MRRSRLIALATIAALASCTLTAALAPAGDRREDSQADKQFTEPVPVKKYDLSKVDANKPPVEPVPAKPPEQAEAPKVKPIVRHHATELVPEGAEIVLEIPDLARARRSAGGSPLGRLMADDTLGPVWSRHIVQRMRNLPPAAEGLPGGDALVDLFNRVGELLSGEVVAAVFPPAEGGRDRRLLLVAELEGARRTAFEDSIEDFKALAGLSRDTIAEKLSRDEFEFWRLTSRNGLVATWGFVGNQLVVEVSRGASKGGRQLYADLVLKAAVSRGDKSLAREEVRAEQMEVLGKDADFYLRADVKSLAQMASSAEAGDQLAAAAGLQGVRYVAAALRFESGAAREKIFAALDPQSPLAKLLPRTAPAADLAKAMPLDACYFEIERVEPGAAARAFGLFKARLSEAARKELDGRVAEIEKKSGLSLEEDILPAFAGDVASAYTVRTTSVIPDVDMVMVIHPDDMEKLKKALAGLEKAFSGPDAGEFKSESYLSAQVHYLEKPKTPVRSDLKAAPQDPFALGLGRGGSSEMGSPMAMQLTRFGAYAVLGTDVIIGTSARAVKMSVRQRDPAQHTSNILDKADLKAARAVLGSPANELSYGYMDLHRIGEIAYSLAGASGAFSELPPIDRVLDEVTGLTWSLRREKKGVSVEVISSVGLMPLATALLAKGTLDAIDAEAAAERAANTAKLKAIWRGMELFSTEFGRYPLNLSELYPTYVTEPDVFLTPRQQEADDKVAISKAEEVDVKSGYRYVPGRTPNAVGNTLLLYSIKPNAAGRHWCLFVNGAVRDVPAEGLANLIGGRKSAHDAAGPIK